MPAETQNPIPTREQRNKSLNFQSGIAGPSGFTPDQGTYHSRKLAHESTRVPDVTLLQPETRDLVNVKRTQNNDIVTIVTKVKSCAR